MSVGMLFLNTMHFLQNIYLSDHHYFNIHYLELITLCIKQLFIQCLLSLIGEGVFKISLLINLLSVHVQKQSGTEIIKHKIIKSNLN